MTTQVNSTNGTAPAASFSEAPASATVEAFDPTGRRWLLTTRAATTGELLTRLPLMQTWLDEHGYTHTRAMAQGVTQAPGDAPMCPTHQKAMKQGQRGWYCPAKIADDGGNGKPVYCRHTAK